MLLRSLRALLVALLLVLGLALPPAALASDAPEIKTGVRAAMSSSGGGSPVPKASAQ